MNTGWSATRSISLGWLVTTGAATWTSTPASGGRRTDILLPEENWQLVAEGYEFTEGPAVNQQGEVYVSDIPNSRIYKIGADAKVTLFAEDTGKANGLMFGPDGRLYACAGEHRKIVSYDAEGQRQVVADGVTRNDLVITAAGRINCTNRENRQVGRVTA